MTFLKTRSGDPVGRPGRETRSGDFVGTPPQVRDIRGGGARYRQSIWFQTYSHLWSIRIQILCCPSGSQPMARFNTEAGKKEFLKVLVNY